MSEIVERVARAFCRAEGYTHPDEDWRYYTNGALNQVVAEVELGRDVERWKTYRRHARAAIAAMREPTKEMIGAAWAEAHDENALGVWRDMIDAALAEQLTASSKSTEG